MKFDETGGYDCMTGAWIISQGGKRLFSVDLADYGDAHCIVSEQAKEAARLVAEKALYGIINPSPIAHRDNGLRAFTVNVLTNPPIYMIELGLEPPPHHETRTIYGTSLADAKKRAGIE
jgi:hypothetical protein